MSPKLQMDDGKASRHIKFVAVCKWPKQKLLIKDQMMNEYNIILEKANTRAMLPYFYGDSSQQQGFAFWISPELLQSTIQERNRCLVQQNQILRNEIFRIRQELKATRSEMRQELCEKNRAVVVKRRMYSKRRDWLQKKFECGVEGCEHRYSSKIALNFHIRKRHNSRPTQISNSL